VGAGAGLRGTDFLGGVSGGPGRGKVARCQVLTNRFSLDETLVDVAPSPRWPRREPGGDRMVGFLVVRPGVPVWRVIGTGHPAAGQADHKARRVTREAPAVRAVS